LLIHYLKKKKGGGGKKKIWINYRPICLLTGFSKMFELLIYRRLNKDFHIHNSFITEHVMLHKSWPKLLWMLRQQQIQSRCFLWPDKRIGFCESQIVSKKKKKLQFYANGILLEWLMSCLYNRKQSVELKFSVARIYSSSWKNVKPGVPQGISIGVTPVQSYINDLPCSVDNNANMIIYTDDTSILSFNNCYEELNRIFNEGLSNTLKWFQVNQMVLHMEKIKTVAFTIASFSNSPLQLILGENLPVITNTISCLGLQLGSQLSWTPHIYFLLHKLSSVCFIMRRLYPIHNILIVRTVYSAHFHSFVNYRIIFWGNTSSKHKVFLIQNNKCCSLLITCITYKLIPLFMTLTQDIKINYIYC
jgi:hypothetical protein